MKSKKQLIMKSKKRIIALILALSMLLSLCVIANDMPTGVNAAYTRTYTQMVDYNYDSRNQGFYMVPDQEGKYPVIFMFHGASEKSSSNWEYRAYIMDAVNKWIALGYMDPMVIIVPNIEREDEKDDWSCYAFYYYVTKKSRFDTLLNKVKNGECEFDDKIDHSKKFSVTGFSMGGVESLFIGSSYKNDFVNVGACSPSYMYYHLNNKGESDGWVTKDRVNFSSDHNAHLMMGYGIQETDFHTSVDRYYEAYNSNRAANQRDFQIYNSYNDGHTWETFKREIFNFVYYIKHDSMPDDATIEEACANSDLNYGSQDSQDSQGNEANKEQNQKNTEASQASNNQEEQSTEQSNNQASENKSTKKQDINNNADNGQTAEQSSNSDSSNQKSAETYSNEWVNGKWYNSDGSQSYDPTMSWNHNENGWWIHDTSGWFPVSCWQKIDGYWYYFDESGYMESSTWRDGYWLGSDGAWTYEATASWKTNGNGWWFEDTSGWYPYSQWQKINGNWYYFDYDGYMVTNKNIDGYWIGADGICQ